MLSLSQPKDQLCHFPTGKICNRCASVWSSHRKIKLSAAELMDKDETVAFHTFIYNLITFFYFYIVLAD